MIIVAILALLVLAWIAYHEWQRQRLIENVGTFEDFLTPIPEHENAASSYLQAHFAFTKTPESLSEETQTALIRLVDSSVCPCKSRLKGVVRSIHRMNSPPISSINT
ncbi:MAG: hypothetical protein WD873_00715 [Candidatus Hydrogenedentales bacterium]